MPSDPPPSAAANAAPSVQKVTANGADRGTFRTLGGSPGGSEVLLMLLADARLPTGAHTQSAGLETAMRHGVSLADVPAYIRTRLRTVVVVEAGAAVVARHLAAGSAGGPGTPPVREPAAVARDLEGRLRDVDDAWRARTVSPALRENAEVLGRGYARLVTGLWPDAAASVALRAVRRPTRAVAIGVAGALAGLDGAQVARLIGYDDAQTVAAAALKLDPLDPLVATGWVVGVAGDIERMASAVASLTTAEQIPAVAAPLIEQWAQQHAVARQRLFRA
jgi:urease accessory protein